MLNIRGFERHQSLASKMEEHSHKLAQTGYCIYSRIFSKKFNLLKPLSSHLQNGSGNGSCQNVLGERSLLLPLSTKPTWLVFLWLTQHVDHRFSDLKQ